MENNRISLTPTVARQTPSNSFGDVLQNTLKTAGQVSGSLLSAVPGGGIISAAVNNVTALASHAPTGSATRAASGIVSMGGGSLGTGVAGSAGGSGIMAGGGGSVSTQVTDSSGGVSPGLPDMLQQMRAEADRSMVMQMNMQQESREYNALSNVIKVRHDSAKAAINNLR